MFMLMMFICLTPCDIRKSLLVKYTRIYSYITTKYPIITDSRQQYDREWTKDKSLIITHDAGTDQFVRDTLTKDWSFPISLSMMSAIS